MLLPVKLQYNRLTGGRHHLQFHLELKILLSQIVNKGRTYRNKEETFCRGPVDKAQKCFIKNKHSDITIFIFIYATEKRKGTKIKLQPKFYSITWISNLAIFLPAEGETCF